MQRLDFISGSGNGCRSYNLSVGNDICFLSNYEKGMFDAVAMLRIIMSSLGILGSSSIIISALIRCRVRSSEVHPIFMLSLADCMLAVLWIAGSIMWYVDPNSYDNVWCYAVTLMTAILECAAINLTLVYAILAYIRIKGTNVNELIAHRISDVSCRCITLLYLTAWILPLVLIMILFGILSAATGFLKRTDRCTCWCLPTAINILPLARYTDKEVVEFILEQHKFLIGLMIWLVINYTTVFTGLVVLYWMILKRINQLNQERVHHLHGATNSNHSAVQERHSKARTRVVLFLAVFLAGGLFNIVVFLFFIVIAFSHLIHVPNVKKNLTFSDLVKAHVELLFAQSLTLPFQGFLNALVYGWTRDDFVNKVTQQRLMEETTTLIEQEPLHEPTDGMVLVRENPYNASGENIRVLNFDEESLDQEHMVTSIEESNLH